MVVPVAAFALFFILFAIVVVIVLAKVRADARRAAAVADPAPLPRAQLAGARRRLAQRIHEPGAYAYGLGLAALLSAVACVVLANVHSRPEGPVRRTYRLINPFDGTVETRELTEQELHEQYQSPVEELKRMQPTP